MKTTTKAITPEASEKFIPAPTTLKTMKVADLNPAPYNPRTIQPKAKAGLRQSIKRFGLVEPIIVNQRTGFVVGGHQRLDILKDIGAITTPVVLVDLPTKEEKALNVALNNPSIMGEFTDQLAGILEEIKTFDASAFADLRFDTLVSNLKITLPGDVIKEDEVPPLPEKPVTKPGDIIQLGDHKVLCGDSTNAKDVDILFGSENSDCLFTSPPYNVGINYSDHADTAKYEQYQSWLKGISKNYIEHLGKGRAFIWNIGVSRLTKPHHQAVMLESLGLEFIRQFVWEKVGVPIPSFYHTLKSPVARQLTSNFIHEMVYVLANGPLEPGAAVTFDRTLEGDVFNIAQSMASVDVPSGKYISGAGKKSGLTNSKTRKAHPAVFPVKLPAAFLQHYTAPGERVVDPFMGSGTTLIAAHQMGRRAFGMEISPAYCDVIVYRFEKISGTKAKRIPRR
jgi:DNA modification methylase